MSKFCVIQLPWFCQKDANQCGFPIFRDRKYSRIKLQTNAQVGITPGGSGLICILPFWPGASGWYIFEAREMVLMEWWFQNIESAKRPAKETTLPSYYRGKKQNRKVRLTAVNFTLWPRKEWTLMFTLYCFHLALLSLMLNILSFKGRWQNRQRGLMCVYQLGGWSRVL